ncbi:hypothetical protein [Chryseobacterium gallinarum]|uniref:Cytochrome C551 n=1 Tax=Chryseobacterium gallinarum TaxID=1324352 RepID=A0A0G3MBW9_CHRGL|nr:hypothetical protein [Chryseobacterium gallinarum]AKK74562.1 hypothetical protein OK18_19840 [Chryseobacterium gallinarum]MCL8538392.1 hypothetical protein [Chryseobacterium gallinarum]QIY89643.1 hypothetical protein FOB44_02780 [Chryseobacterium gallinarum]
MKLIMMLMLFTGFLIISCKKQPQTEQTHIDTLNTGDSIVSGTAQITPDSGDNTLPMDSTAYDVDSIKNSK